MNEVLTQAGTRQFRVEYPYYGLFGSARITAFRQETETIFECLLLNGDVLLLKKQSASSWIDAQLNHSTPLASVIGTSIDDFLRVEHK